MLVAPVTTPVFAAPNVVDTITVGNSPNSVAFSPNGEKAYVANGGDGTVSVITVATGDVVDTITVGDYPSSVAFSPSGEKAYVANFDDGTVSVINTSRSVGNAEALAKTGGNAGFGLGYVSLSAVVLAAGVMLRRRRIQN